jgi:hypothetical protein
MDSDFEGFRVDTQYSFFQHDNRGDDRIIDALTRRRATAIDPAPFPIRRATPLAAASSTPPRCSASAPMMAAVT